jgi:hypothetical protein
MKLSILIPTIVGREGFYNALMFDLTKQIIEGGYQHEVEILTNKDNREKSIGQKRNELLAQAVGKYSCFIDCDDKVSSDYMRLVMEGIDTDPDCLSLVGNYYLDGVFYKPFIHSTKYTEWSDDAQYYYRCPNHLNVIKRELIADIPFAEVYFGEDGQWSYAVRDSGRLKTEYEIKEVLYYYYHRSAK